ncbi:hypothetical protein R6Z07F_010502 [Ovis aries]
MSTEKRSQVIYRENNSRFDILDSALGWLYLDHRLLNQERIWILDRENPNTSEYCQLIVKLGHLISEPYLHLQKLEDSDKENLENFDMGFIQESLVYLLCVYCKPSGMLLRLALRAPPFAKPLPSPQGDVTCRPIPPAPAHCLFPAVRMRRRRSALGSVSARGCGGAGGFSLSGSSLGGGGGGSVDASSAS